LTAVKNFTKKQKGFPSASGIPYLISSIPRSEILSLKDPSKKIKAKNELIGCNDLKFRKKYSLLEKFMLLLLLEFHVFLLLLLEFLI